MFGNGVFQHGWQHDILNCLATWHFKLFGNRAIQDIWQHGIWQRSIWQRSIWQRSVWQGRSEAVKYFQ